MLHCSPPGDKLADEILNYFSLVLFILSYSFLDALGVV